MTQLVAHAAMEAEAPYWVCIPWDEAQRYAEAVEELEARREAKRA